MTLDHTQLERLSEALMDAFPSYERLKRMAAYKLNINLEVCTGSRKLVSSQYFGARKINHPGEKPCCSDRDGIMGKREGRSSFHVTVLQEASN